jgi:hypothetical protein
MLHNVHVKLNPDCHGTSSIQQEEGHFHQKIGLQFKEEISKVLHLEHSSIWC